MICVLLLLQLAHKYHNGYPQQKPFQSAVGSGRNLHVLLFTNMNTNNLKSVVSVEHDGGRGVPVAGTHLLLTLGLISFGIVIFHGIGLSSLNLHCRNVPIYENKELLLEYINMQLVRAHIFLN